jgi:hypothetical protein
MQWVEAANMIQLIDNDPYASLTIPAACEY